MNLYAYVSNNVCNGSDEDGNNSLVIGAAALAREMITTLFGVYVLVKTAPLLYQVAKGCVQTVTDIAENIKQRTPNQKKDNRKKKDQVVYTLREPVSDKVLYVGRTNNLKRRKYEHDRDPIKKELRFKAETGKMSYAAARGTEELLIRKFRTLEEGLNKVHGISTLNPYYDYFIEQATDYMYAERKIAKCPWD